jgi:hypothetical protein
MTYSAFSAGEILRYSKPNTDLEKRMFELLEIFHDASSEAIRLLSDNNIEGAFECLEAAECGRRWVKK